MNLEWLCDECKLPIEDSRGWVTINLGAVGAHERSMAEWKRNHPGPVVSGSDLMDIPLPVLWHVYHRACDPDLDRLAYWFAVERCRTIPQLMDWWLHLAEKNWFSATAWDVLIRQRVLPQLAKTEPAPQGGAH